MRAVGVLVLTPALPSPPQTAFLGMQVVRRGDLLGPRCSFGGLYRCSRDQTVLVYELALSK